MIERRIHLSSQSQRLADSFSTRWPNALAGITSSLSSMTDDSLRSSYDIPRQPGDANHVNDPPGWQFLSIKGAS